MNTAATSLDIYVDHGPLSVAHEIVHAVAQGDRFIVRQSRRDSHRWFVGYDPDRQHPIAGNAGEINRLFYIGMIHAAMRRPPMPAMLEEDATDRGNTQYLAGYAEALRLL